MYHPLAICQTTQPKFLELFYNLNEEVKNGNVSVLQHRQYPGLHLYNYTRECAFSRNWNTITKSARGLILDHINERIVGFSMPKFFNLGEHDATYEYVLGMFKDPKQPCKIYEKYDGSCGIAFHWNDQWHVATRGSFESDQAKVATEFLRVYADQYKDTEWALVPGTTYIFEIIYPENRIVVQYQFEGLVCLCAYSSSGHYIPPEQAGIHSCILITASQIHFNVFPAVPLNQHKEVLLDNLIETSKQLSLTSEGFVIHSNTGEKVKIKGEEYCRVHRLVSRVTPIGVWEILSEAIEYACQPDEQGNPAWDRSKMVQKLDEYKASIPEEFWSDIDKISGLLLGSAEKIISVNRSVVNSTEHLSLSRKEFAQMVEVAASKYSLHAKIVPAIMFMLYDRKNEGTIMKVVMKNLRPMGNTLAGYTPSTIYTRFVSQES